MRNDPNKVLRTSTSTTLNARDYKMVLADATSGAIALVLISPAGLSEWSIKVANVGSANNVTLSVTGGGSFSFTLPPTAAVIIEQDDLGVLHAFGSSNGNVGALSMATPTGAVNGINVTFVFTAPPIQVFYQGILQALTTDYTLAGSTVTFNVAPVTGVVSGLIAT